MATATPSQFYYSSHHYSPRNLQLTSMKIKTLLQAHFFPHVCHVVRALSKASSKVMEYLRWKYVETDLFVVDASSMCRKKMGVMMMKKKAKKKKNKFGSSFRVCCNWHSSHVLPIVPAEAENKSMEEFDRSHMYYDSTWNSVICTEEGGGDELGPQLSGYLQWLDEKTNGDHPIMACNEKEEVEEDDGDEIDRLAEMFIAKCHEKFRLEKQESYRRYQEMLARSM